MDRNTSEYKTFFNAPFLMLFAYNILFCMSYGLIAPILVQYLAGRGIAIDVAGAIAGVVSLTSLVIRPLSGYFTDLLNKKHLLIFASLMLGIAMVALAFSGSIPMILLSRVCQGIGFSINGTCCIAMAAAYMPQDRLSEGIGYFGIANIISSAAAPALGIELAARIGYQSTILLAGGSVLLASLCIAGLRQYCFEQKEAALRSVVTACRQIRPSKLFAAELLPLVLFVGAFSFANSVVATYLAPLCQERGISGYSAYFTINAVVMIAARPFLGKLSDRRGLSVVLYPAYLITAAAIVLIGGAGTILPIYLASVLKALGQGSGQPALQAECLKRLGPESRGLATSTFYIGSDVANGLGPMIGGWVAARGNYSSVFSLSAVILVTAFVGYLIYSCWQNRHPRKI